MRTLLRSATLLLLTVMALSGASLVAACVAGPNTLCLNNQRFRVEVEWKDFQGGTGVGQAIPLTSDTGYFWFFNSANVELVVKVLDGRGLNGKFWVFFGALSNVEYTLKVTDTVSGTSKTYFNPSGQFASVGDTSAFWENGSVAAAFAVIEGSKASTPIATRSSAVTQAQSTCVALETSLCLNGGRFRVEANWKDFQGNTGVGKAVSLTPDTGYFWFFNDANVELAVKVLDGRVLNQKFWVFYGALSNVEYEMTVTDTLTGNVSTYTNPSGRFASTGDTAAFSAGHAVTVRLDEIRAVSADIPTDGGTISATGSDGTVFRLTIPADALLSDAKITMTPVAAIDGLPLSGGLAAAVGLQPTGLNLFKAATLTIVPGRAVPLAEEITFAWRGSGEEFFLYPPELDTSAVTMKVYHFSGYGVGRGTAPDEAAQRQRIPANSDDALNQQLQELVATRRRTQSNKIGAFADDEFGIRYKNLLLAYYNDLLKAKLERAKTSCAVAKATVAPAAWFVQQATHPYVLGCCPSEVLNVNSVMSNVLWKCFDESFDQCVSKKDPVQVKEMMAYYAAFAAFGDVLFLDLDKMERCARFELRFGSRLQYTSGDDGFVQAVGAKVPIRVSRVGDFRWFTGTGLLETFEVEYRGACTTATVGGVSVFVVDKLTLDINFYEGDGSPPEPILMAYNPGEGVNIITITGPANCLPAPPAVPDPGWWAAYRAYHAVEQIGDFFLARGWRRVGGALYARKEYRQEHIVTEDSFMELWHTPDAP